jgi:hypothetical protein
MLMDKQTLFSEAQAITATAASTNHIDLGVARNIGVGENLYLVLTVTEAFTDSGSDSTVTPSLETDEDDGFATALATIRTYDTLPALSPVGTKKIYRLDPVNDIGTYKQFLRLKYTVAGGNLSTGKITAGLVVGVEAIKDYPTNFNVT